MSAPSAGAAMLITCVLYRGGGEKVLRALFGRGITRTGHSPARGSAIGDPVESDGLPRQFEKEVVTCVVDASEADEVFAFIFETAEIDRPHGGFMYMERLGRASAYALPDGMKEA